MHTAIRLFNPEGIRRFRSALQALKDGGAAEVPALLTDATLTQVIAPQVQADNSLRFATSLELARYLHERIVQLPLADRFYHVGLWAWLSAFYLDAVAPAEQGRRKIGEIVRYIPPDNRNFYEIEVHLLGSAVRLLHRHGEQLAQVFLYTPPHQRSDLLREITGSPELAMSRGVIEALGILYWDAGRGRPKVGIKSSDELAPGTSRRFVALLNQFSRTYDLQGMTGEQIVRLLPEREFSRWFTPPPP
jgi:hypothetical protein